MSQSKYFPDLQDNKDYARVDPIEDGFFAVAADINILTEEQTAVRSEQSAISAEIVDIKENITLKENVSNKTQDTGYWGDVGSFPDTGTFIIPASTQMNNVQYPTMALLRTFYNQCIATSFSQIVSNMITSADILDENKLTDAYYPTTKAMVKYITKRIGETPIEYLDPEIFDPSLVGAINNVFERTKPFIRRQYLRSDFSSNVLDTGCIYEGVGTEPADEDRTITLRLPSGATYGDWLQVDFYMGDDPPPLEISGSCLSEIDLVPESNTAYSLFFDYGVISGEEYSTVLGWRMTYTAYPHTEV